MKNIGAVVFGLIWMIVVMLVGFLVIGNLVANINTDLWEGAAIAGWNTFISFVWLAMGILAFFPLIIVAIEIMGLFSGTGATTG